MHLGVREKPISCDVRNHELVALCEAVRCRRPPGRSVLNLVPNPLFG